MSDNFNYLSVSKLVLGVLFSGFILMAASCDRSRMDKGYEYFPDMAHSPSYQTYSENPAMEDGKTMREPVAGTIPRHLVPYPYPADEQGRDMAGQVLFNPLEANDDIIAQGELLYGIFCFNCHGPQGDGKGNLFTSGKYVIPPASLITPEALEYPSGEIYHVITAGWGVMGAHGPLIQPEERWKIIHFIETTLQKEPN